MILGRVMGFRGGFGWGNRGFYGRFGGCSVGVLDCVGDSVREK